MNKECQHHLFKISNRLELMPLLDGDFSESTAEARPVYWRLLTGIALKTKRNTSFSTTLKAKTFYTGGYSVLKHTKS